MGKYDNLSKKELREIKKQVEQRHNSSLGSFEKHYDHIAKYCIKHGLRNLSFKRGKKGNPNSVNVSCETFNPLDFVTAAQRKTIQKQLEKIS